MGNNKSHESQAASNKSNQSTSDSCESAAKKYGVMAEISGKKKTQAKIGGGVASGVLMGTGVAAGSTAGAIAVAGTIASIAVGIPTLGVGLIVGLAATAGTAGVAAGAVGIAGAVTTHFIAKHYEDDETTFREVQEDFLTNCANTRPDDVADESDDDDDDGIIPLVPMSSIILVFHDVSDSLEYDSGNILIQDDPMQPQSLAPTAELPQAPPMNKATAELQYLKLHL